MQAKPLRQLKEICAKARPPAPGSFVKAFTRVQWNGFSPAEQREEFSTGPVAILGGGRDGSRQLAEYAAFSDLLEADLVDLQWLRYGHSKSAAIMLADS